MNSLIIALVVAVISCIMGSLITFLITTISQRSVTKNIIKELIDMHEKVYHKKSPEDLIEEHAKDCVSNNELISLRKGIKFLIVKEGGKPEDLGFV